MLSPYRTAEERKTAIDALVAAGEAVEKIILEGLPKASEFANAWSKENMAEGQDLIFRPLKELPAFRELLGAAGTPGAFAVTAWTTASGCTWRRRSL